MSFICKKISEENILSNKTKEKNIGRNLMENAVIQHQI